MRFGVNAPLRGSLQLTLEPGCWVRPAIRTSDVGSRLNA